MNRRNAKAQAQLIEDLLDVSRIISGKVRLDVKTVLLSEIVEAALDAVRPAAEAKSIKVDIDIHAATEQLRADPARLQQAWAIVVLSEYRQKHRHQGGHKMVTNEKRQAIQPAASY